MIQDGKKPNVLCQLYSTANPPGHRPIKLPKARKPSVISVSFTRCCSHWLHWQAKAGSRYYMWKSLVSHASPPGDQETSFSFDAALKQPGL